ncbi:MAG: D-alanyl-D-alanine carboxypeptidase/D-alanyl-D-alanine-endopeptidase [Thermodesulfobacteriota bacterium]
MNIRLRPLPKRPKICRRSENGTPYPGAGRTAAATLLSCWFFLLFCLLVLPCRAADPFTDRIDRLIDNGGCILADDSGTIIAINADSPFVPASILKIVTALASLRILGPDFRFTTDFFLTEDNDLAIRGSGDPFLTSEEIAFILARLREQGVNRINRIFLDDSAFRPEGDADGRENSHNPYDAANSALAANFNTISLRKSVTGSIVSAEPQTPTLPIMKRLGSGLPAGSHRINLGSSPTDMLTHTGELFRAIQHRQGVAGSGHISVRAVPDSARLVFHHQSRQPLTEIIRDLLHYSNNFIANQLFLACGATEEGMPATWAKGRIAFRRFLDSLGLASKEIVMVEGSGLSRQNRVTPAAMLRILLAFAPHAHLLPDRDGTLVKSGTLSGVASYAGFIASSGKQKPFVIMLNQSANCRDEILKLLEKRARRS